VLNGCTSHSIPVTSGVPQGSILGPVLFTMFVNDIPSTVSSSAFMFADDTKIFHARRSSDDYFVLQNDLNLFYDWSLTCQLSFNILKCKHLHLGPAHNFGPYHLNCVTIDCDSTTTHKDLGILFDECLN